MDDAGVSAKTRSTVCGATDCTDGTTRCVMRESVAARLPAAFVRGRRERGSGMFIALACSALICLIILAVSRLFSSSQVMDLAARGAGGAVAEELAISAIEEGLWRFEKDVNEVDTPIGRRVRDALIESGAGREGAAVDLSDECRPVHLLELRRQDFRTVGANRNLQLEKFSFVFEMPAWKFDRSTGSLVPAGTEQKGQEIKVESVVSVRIGKRLVRRAAKAVYKWGLSHVSEPKPYDQLTIALCRVDLYERLLKQVARLLDLAEEYNVMCKRLNGFIDYLEGFPHGPRGEVESRDVDALLISSTVAPPLDKDEKKKLDEIYGDEDWRIREREMRTENGLYVDCDLDWQDRRRLERTHEGKLHFRLDKGMRFIYRKRAVPVVHNRTLRETPGVDSVTVGLERFVRISEFDLNRKMDELFWPHWESLGLLSGQLREHTRSWRKQLLQDLQGRRIQGRARLAGYCEKSIELLERFRIQFELAITGINTIIRWSLSHTLAPFVSPGQCRSTPYLPVGYHLNQKTVVNDLRYLVDRYGGGVNGHVFIAPLPAGASAGCVGTSSGGEDAGDEPKTVCLNLARWRGATVFSAMRTMRLGCLSLADESRDLLVLGLKKAEFTSSGMRAGITCSDARFLGAPSIGGNLVIGRLRFARGVMGERRLQGTVEYDDRLFSGHFYSPGLKGGGEPGWVVRHNYVVTVSPRSWRRNVSRKVE